MGPTKLLSSTFLVAIIGALSCLGPVQSPEQQLSSGIGSPVPEKYDAVRDAKDWLNPYLQVCADGVDLTVHSVRRKSLVAIRDLRVTLVRLPVEAWPYGRIAALQDCSIGVPGDREASRQRLAEEEAVLKALRVQVSRWPA